MYYRLTHISGPKTDVSGHGLLGGEKSVSIGQTAACDLHLANSSIYQPQVVAIILQRENGDGWIVVRNTDHFNISIDNKPLLTAAVLSEDCVLAFDDGTQVTRLRFKVMKDGTVDEAGRVTGGRDADIRPLTVGLVAVLLVVVAVFCLPRINGERRQLKGVDMGRYESSLFHITVDSVFLTMDTLVEGRWHEEVLKAGELSSTRTGTCFLTQEGFFVTARHCVEPWLDDEDWEGGVLNSKTPIEIRLAAEAETRNRTERDNRYHVKSRCIISNEQEYYEFYSSEFCMNKSRDQVLRLGSDRSPIYWRTISPLASRHDMELGDFAYVKAPDGVVGLLERATMADMLTFKAQASKEIAVIGFPVSDHGVIAHTTVVYGNCQQFDFDSVDDTQRGCLMMTAPVNCGNSGGPVLAYVGTRVLVIGIVSKADAQAVQETFWAVPITEVEQCKERIALDKTDTIMYRR